MPDDKPPQATQTDSPHNQESPRDELPGVRFKKGRHARYTYEQWKAVYLAWKEGERSLKTLSRRFGIDADTVGVWVRKGVSSLHRPSFYEMLRDENEIVREEKARVSARMAEEILDERGKVRQGNLRILMGLRATVGKTLAKAIEKIDTITWTKKEKMVVQVKEKMSHQLVDRPLNAHEYASVLRLLSGAMALVGKMESFFVGDVMDGDEIPEELKFTPDELKFIQTPGNEDKLPPGMTVEQLARKMAAWCGVSPMKAGN